jgi:uncharacterized cupin superfamily protein
MNKVKAVVSRKRFVVAGLLVALMAVAAIWNFNTRTTSAQSTGGFDGAIFKITLGTPSTTATTAGTTFAVEGTITFVNARGQALNSGTGKFFRRGTIGASGFSQVSDTYQLDSFGGSIMSQGVVRGAIVGVIEQADLLAVTGGVGTFRSASGEAQVTTSTDGTLNVVLQEGLRRFGQFGFFGAD